MTNPFAQNVPAAEHQAPPQGAPSNPFAGAAPQPVPAQPAPQAYAPPAQQPYQVPPAPNGYYGQPAPQQPQQQAYAPVPQAAPPALDPNALAAAPPPPPAADGKGAKFENLYGRLVLLFPLSRESKPKNPRFITDQDRASGNLMQDQITATIVAIDDGRGGYAPVTWGGDPMRNVPPTDTAPLPYVRRGMWISQSRVIAQIAPFLPQTPGAPGGMVFGRLVKTGPEHNAPWFLQSPTEADTAAARNYLQLVASGQVPHPLA